MPQEFRRMSERLPARIERYEVLAELGQGAMGIVYKARDPQLERIVAVKTLRRDLGLPPEEYRDLRKRFYQEAKAAGRLNHPNIVTIHDVVEIDDVPYIVMELLEGCTLADLIATPTLLAPERAVKVIVQVCGALEYAHAHGVVHRDIKPGNILVTVDDLAKVSDFGIARIAGSSVTRTGVLVGTPAYMSPEQVQGRGLDGRSDLFSLGVVLYEALTGVNPFQNADLTATLYHVVQVDPPPVRERNPSVPVALAQVTARAMTKAREERYPTARALALALTEALEQRSKPPAPPGARRAALRRATLTVVGLLLVAVASWAWWSREGTKDVVQATRSPAGAGTTAPAPPRPEGPAPRREPQTPRAGPAVSAPPRAETPAVRATTREAVRPGEIVVSTNSSVEVFLDEAPKGRTGEGPLVIKDVATGERRVTLRLGSRQHQLQGTVREGETLWLAYRFPDEPRELPLDKLLEATGDKIMGTARDKFREVTEGLRDLARDKPKAAEPRRPSTGEPR